MRCLSVCPCVCPPVTFVDCVETNKPICNFYYRSMRMPMHNTDYALATCLSIRLFVTHRYSVMHILNFSPSGSTPHHFFRTKQDSNTPTGTPVTGAPKATGMKKSWFLSNISLYLGNDASYCGRRIKNRTQAFEWYQFQWPSMTCNTYRKVSRYYSTLNKFIGDDGKATSR